MHLKSEVQQLITDLLSNFNQSRTCFKMPSDHKINITSYWLLGLLEGEGSFSIGKTEGRNRIKFISQFTIGFSTSGVPEVEKLVCVSIFD